MKKTICLILALFMVVALFAACDSGSNSSSTTAPPATTTTTAPPTSAGNTGSTATEAPAAEADDIIDGMYNLAVKSDGSLKYDLDSRGLPADSFEYTLPISTNIQEVFSFWHVIYSPEMVYTEDFKDMPFQTALREMTGVNVDYIVLASTAMREQFGIMLASDDLPDLMAGAYSYYSGSGLQGIEEGYFANLYDWKEYIPNFLYQIPKWEGRGDKNAYDKIFYQDGIIRAMGLGTEEPMPGSGYCIRGDWLDQLGLKAEDIKTYDQLHDVLVRFKNEIGAEYPMAMISTVEIYGTFACGYNTTSYVGSSALPYVRVVDNKATYSLTREDDLNVLKLYRQWFDENLITPDWASYVKVDDMRDKLYDGIVGLIACSPSEIPALESNNPDPNCRWDAIPRTRLYENQILEYGQAVGGCPSGVNGAVISAKCENIPVLATWVDYGYSPEGSLFKGWGVEGLTWEYDANGNRMLTEFALNNPDGHATAWLLMIYAMNAFADPGMQWHLRVYAFPGGERCAEMMSVVWTEDNYSGSYDWPSVLRLAPDLLSEVNSYAADIATFVAEHYLTFLDGSRPMDEWDSYVSGVMNMGLNRCEEIYTELYQDYMEKVAARG